MTTGKTIAMTRQNKETPDIIAELAEESGLELPQSIAELPSLEVRHKDVIEKEQMMSMVRKTLLG